MGSGSSSHARVYPMPPPHPEKFDEASPPSPTKATGYNVMGDIEQRHLEVTGEAEAVGAAAMFAEKCVDRPSAERRRLTLHEITDHNTGPERETAYWALHQGKVYNITALAEFCVKDSSSETVSIYDLRKGFHHLRRRGLSLKEINRDKDAFYVGDVEVLSVLQQKQDMESELDKIEGEIQSGSAHSEVLNDFARVVGRQRRSGGISRISSSEPGPGNPLERVFPMPVDVNPDSLRPWLADWRPFDTECEPTEVGQVAVPEDFDSTTQVMQFFECSLRAWLPNWEPFTTDVDGEAAWRTLPENVIVEDVALEEQMETWETREARTDLNDQARMLRRRNILANYFLAKYEEEASWVERHMEFAALLEENARALDRLAAS